MKLVDVNHHRAVIWGPSSTDDLAGLDALLDGVRQMTVSSCQETLTNALLVSNIILFISIVLYH